MSLIDIETTETPSLYKGRSVSLLYREEADFFSIEWGECLSSIYRHPVLDFGLPAAALQNGKGAAGLGIVTTSGPKSKIVTTSGPKPKIVTTSGPQTVCLRLVFQTFPVCVFVFLRGVEKEAPKTKWFGKKTTMAKSNPATRIVDKIHENEVSKRSNKLAKFGPNTRIGHDIGIGILVLVLVLVPEGKGKGGRLQGLLTPPL